MKPFLLQILKCNNCSNLQNLTLEIKKLDKVEYDLTKLPILPSTQLINELNQLIKENDGFYLNKDDLSNLTDDNINLIKMLFCNEVIEGELICKGCSQNYSISEGIPSFVKKDS